MTTTYSNPKEMLGYLVVKFIDRQLEVLNLFPYDRRAVFAYYYQIKGLDAQLVSFRSDMFLISEDDGQRISYSEAMEQISELIKQNWDNVYGKEYDLFLKAVYKWSELIASCYPKLGLVPETGEVVRAHQEENILEDDNAINENQPEQTDTIPGTPTMEPEPERGSGGNREPDPRVSKREVEPVVRGNSPRQKFRF